MFARAFPRISARASSSSSSHSHVFTRRAHQPLMHSASLFTACIGLGTCPKRRRKQSNEESGEDAYFINVKDKSVSFGVFDGVGGWADSGVDPSIFSHGLARHCHAASSSASSSSSSSPSKDSSPAQVLIDGYEALLKDDKIAMGSSTACVASVDLEDGVLRVANLGDSGYCLLSLDGQVLHTSKPQTYYFNAPYQLAKMPASMRSPGSLENTPQDADVTQHRLSTDQIVLLATDGFFDNIYPKDAGRIIASTARECADKRRTKKEMVDTMAEKLRDAARTAGRSNKNGPFANEAKAHRLRYEGGKEDDICIIVVAIDVASLKSKL